MRLPESNKALKMRREVRNFLWCQEATVTEHKRRLIVVIFKN